LDETFYQHSATFFPRPALHFPTVVYMLTKED
jgi:hypothetical protein